MRHLLIFTTSLLLLGAAIHAQPADKLTHPSDGVLTLSEALRIATANYQRIRAAEQMVRASALELKAARQDGLPNLNFGIETAYGTLDGMNGLSSGEPGLTALTNGPAVSSQNWNAAFGALYLTNINFNLFSFGLQRAHVAAAQGQYDQDRQALEQQIFQQQVRTAGAWLSLLAATRVRTAMEANLLRTSELRDVILARTVNGLNAGVDSSIANAEVSKARLSLIDAQNYEQQQANQLSIQMGINPRSFVLDTTTAQNLPRTLLDSLPADFSGNPDLQFLASRITTSDRLARYIAKTGLPRLTLFGVGQERGSGFGSGYASNSADYSTSFFQGIQPERANYLVGVGITWNFTDLGRSRSRSAAQHQRSESYRSEYLLEQNTLLNQLALSDQQIRNALTKYKETPIQLQSASDAYLQKKALYENGLTNIVDVTQTLYLLNRAEIDRDIACNAVWQAVLFKAGTQGDIHPFLNQF
ncbi:MAG TPA: TolC family protein [Puia sp.]|nr:TolC family protein [Puia sp.]